MRNTIFITLLLAALCAKGQLDLESLIKSEREAFYKKQQLSQKRSGQDYDVVYQHLYIEVDPAVRYVEGEVFNRIQARESAFSLFALDLAGTMQVDSVLFEGQHLAFNHQNDEILISSPMLDSAELFEFTVYYQGDPTANSQRGFSVDNHMTGPIAWTLSEPYGAYGWWPCKQQLADKIDSFDMSVLVPEGNKAAGLGLLRNVDTLADRSLIFHWVHRYPVVTYLVAVAVTNYEEFSHFAHFTDGDSLLVLEYMYPEFMFIADTQALKIEPMLRLFDSLCGPYPFRNEKYGHAMWGRGGGMEHQTMSFMSDLDFSLMAHELAHQWYGNKITCGSWQDIWLNEGFATYFTAVAYEFLAPRSEYLAYLEITRDRAMIQNDGSVFVNDTNSVSRIFSGPLSYRKGAMVLQMLRWELGDSLFFEAMRAYTEQVELCYGFARTEDLIDACESVSQTNLDPFFDRWVYGEGFPLLNIRWYRTGPDRVNVSVEQTTSHPSISFYPLKIELLFLAEDGRDSSAILDLTSNQQNFDLRLGFKAKKAIYDPNIHLLAKTNLVEGAHQDLQNIHLFPNPAGSKVSVYIQDRKIDEVAVYDLQGRLLLETTVLSKLNESAQLSLDGLQSGIYTIRVSSGTERYVLKLIKS